MDAVRVSEYKAFTSPSLSLRVIQGYVEDGRPYILGMLSLPRLGSAGVISFLVDTAADTTIVNPAASRDLGIDFARDFPDKPTATSLGTGGPSAEYVEPGLLSFMHQDGTPENIGLRVGIALPTHHNAAFSSVLGLDVLRYFRLTFEPHSRLLHLEEPA